MFQTTATLSEARYFLSSTASGEFTFFAGGYIAPTQPMGNVDIYTVTSGSWTKVTLSIPRSDLVAVSTENLVFFGGGWDGISI
jgi:hypothetical protein